VKLKISQLAEGENRFQYSSPTDVGAGDIVERVRKSGHEPSRPMMLDLAITKLEPDYYLKGLITFGVRVVCARCTDPYNLEISERFEAAFNHQVRKKGGAKASLLTGEDSDEPDVNVFEGPEIDLAPVIEEQVYLAMPFQAVCSSACKGLCQHCGVNLNMGVCRCIPAMSHAVLSEVLKGVEVT
jgi:uncharacterized protein